MSKQTFTEKFIEKFDRIDKSEITSFVVKTVREKGFLENILKSLDDGVIVLDDRKDVQFINASAREIAGVNQDVAVMGKPIDRLIKDGALSDFVYNEDVRSGQSVSREIELFFPRKLLLSVSLMPLLDEGENVCGMAVIMRDITEKRKLEGRIVQSERLGALSVLAAGLAHEIGNPLNSLHIHAQLIEKESAKLKLGKKKIAGLIKIISEEIKRIDDIARNFLQAVRPLKSKFDEDDVNVVLDKTIKFLMPELAASSIVVDKLFSDSMPLTLLDKSQLKQAFLNIIKNSIQAMPKGGVIKVSTSCHNDIIRIVFEDSGRGIAPENISRIFDPYFTTRKDGMGLGLMMTYRIVKEHGGEIEVKSQIGKGTVFTIMLPVRTITPKMLPKT